ncbi:Calx-beta domain-containing protein [Paludisphaera soli]|uniref:Calx-beta domain-containing protein n=1 Tax=Paludisphaera soli TaxID=2712865 RepID=UPI0013EADEB2|nr:Calx-beta domain-containing protein [Paludisphaera soli]
MLFDRLIARRRRQAVTRTTRPDVEPMEQRQLLTAYLTVDSPRITEGTGGATTMNFTVKLMLPSTQPVTVSYGTANRTAVAGSDYNPAYGTLTFAPGETAKTVPVSIIPDSLVETTEIFDLNLTNPVNATIFTKTGTGTTLDDDAVLAPALTVADVRMTRGLNGSRTMDFTVNLNQAQRTSVSVSAATSAWTAIAGVDFQTKSQVLTFAPGETSKTFSVTIFGTSIVSADKKFLVRLSGSTATLSRSTAAGTLVYGA